MGKRRKVPEDLMGTILGEGRPSPEPRGDGQETTSPPPSGGETFSWEEQPERVGVTFNLSKQLIAELDRLRREPWLEGDVRPSRSEIAEAALRSAVDDVRERGGESELSKRLGGRATGGMSQRSVDESGFIVETVYDENGRVVDEDVVATLSELPVETEYVDEQGRLVSLAKDELGNTFEWVMDEQFNMLGTRILRGANHV